MPHPKERHGDRIFFWVELKTNKKRVVVRPHSVKEEQPPKKKNTTPKKRKKKKKGDPGTQIKKGVKKRDKR